MRSQTNIKIVILDFLDRISDSNFAATIHPKAEPDEKEGKPIFTQDSAMMYNFLPGPKQTQVSTFVLC